MRGGAPTVAWLIPHCTQRMHGGNRMTRRQPHQLSRTKFTAVTGQQIDRTVLGDSQRRPCSRRRQAWRGAAWEGEPGQLRWRHAAVLQPPARAPGQGHAGPHDSIERAAAWRAGGSPQQPERPRARLWTKRGRRGRLSKAARDAGRVPPGRSGAPAKQPGDGAPLAGPRAKPDRCRNLARRQQEQRRRVAGAWALARAAWALAHAARPSTRRQRCAGRQSAGRVFWFHWKLYFHSRFQPRRPARNACTDNAAQRGSARVARRDSEEQGRARPSCRQDGGIRGGYTAEHRVDATAEPPGVCSEVRQFLSVSSFSCPACGPAARLRC